MTAPRPEGRTTLTEQEQVALRAIQQDLRATNPELANAMARGIRSKHWRWQAILLLADATAVLLLATGLFTGRPGMAVLGALALAVLLGAPIAVRRKKIRRLAETERP